MESHLGKFQVKIEWTFRISPAQEKPSMAFFTYNLHAVQYGSDLGENWKRFTHTISHPHRALFRPHTLVHSNSLEVPIVCHTNESNARTIPINSERFLMFMLLLTLCFCSIHLPLNHSSCLRSHISSRSEYTKFVLLFLYIRRLNTRAPRAHTEADLLIWCANKACNTIEFYQRQFPQQ